MTQTKTLFSIVAIALLIVFAGCSGFAGESTPAGQSSTSDSTPEATPTSEPTPEATLEPTQEATLDPTPEAAPTPEPTETEADNEELTRAEKFAAFDENMNALYEFDDDYNRSTISTQAFPKNDSYHITFHLRDSSNQSKLVDDRLEPLYSYSAIVEDYNSPPEEDQEPRDHTWIPDTVNITFVTEDGGVWETRYIKYNWAYKHATGDWSFRIMFAKYGSSVEEGPAYTGEPAN